MMLPRRGRFARLYHAILGIFGAVAIGHASAWSDEGHLLVATIAKLLMPPFLLKQLETTLEKWDVDFPGTGLLQTAAVWLDHLSCRDPSPYCSGFKALDDVQVFRTWHYSSRVFNPQNIELGGIYKYYPLPRTGAEWALTTVYASLKEAHSPEANSSSTSQVLEQPVKSYKRGSSFSLNLHLRLLLHIFGDIHQPLHAGSLFANGFPHGDEGGNAIPVQHEAHIGNLHQLWDTAGGMFKKSFDELSWPELKKAAMDIMEQFPKESLAERLTGDLAGTNFAAIAEESAGIALKVAYSEFDWATFSKASLPYRPSDRYMHTVVNEAKKQIAIAGYRLTYVLTSLVNSLHIPLSPPYMAEQHQIQEQEQSVHKSKIDFAFLSWAAATAQQMPLPRLHGILREALHLGEGPHELELLPVNDKGKAQSTGATGLVVETERLSVGVEGLPPASEL